MTDADYSGLASFACELADRARVRLRACFRAPVVVELKDDRTPVTAVDRAIEEELREQIRRRHPEHGILGEELGAERVDAEFVWVLDPIDGTKAFASGKPVFGTLVGLLHAGRPVVGVIDSPITQERWLGVPGAPTRFNGKPVAVRAERPLASAVIYTGSPAMFAGADRDGFDRVLATAQWINYDCDCYAYGLLALGTVDAVIETDLEPSDYCALVPVVANAGGVMTDWGGAALGPGSGEEVVAATSRALAEEIVRTMRPAAAPWSR